MPSMILSVAALSFAAAVFGAQAEYQQCGGIGWTGGTTCASPYVCTVLNNYYYQCLPGSSTASTVKPTTTTTTTTSSSSSKPTTTSTTTSSSASSSPTSSTNPAGVPRLGGVNMAGFDFGVSTDGSFSGKNSAPPSAQFAHFSAEGVNFFRVPTAWQFVQPTPGGPLSSNISVYDQTMQTCLATGAYCILDIHNYARFNGAIVGQGGPTNAQFAQLWSLLAAKYASQSKVIFGIMNEPHDLNVPTWATSVQGAVTAIRAAGAKSQLILIPGDQYTGTAAFPGEWGPIMKSVVDSDGTTSKLIFDLHRYLDSDGSGTHNDCVSNRVSDFQAAVSYLQSIGRQGAVTEIGGGPDQTCLTDLPQAISYIASAYPTLIGFAGWGAGGFDNTYNLDLGPTPNYSGAGQGTDSTQWVDGFKPYLP